MLMVGGTNILGYAPNEPRLSHCAQRLIFANLDSEDARTGVVQVMGMD